MKPKKTPFAALILAIFLMTPSYAAQAQVEAGSQPAVAALRELARSVKECPEFVFFQDQWGRKPNEIAKYIAGPPFNVTWDVKRNESVRSPYLGSIEFSLRRYFSILKEVVKDYEKRFPGRLLVEDSPKSNLIYRFEFDLGPSGLELTKMLTRLDGANERTDWADHSPSSSFNRSCWEKVVVKASTRPAPTNN